MSTVLPFSFFFFDSLLRPTSRDFSAPSCLELTTNAAINTLIMRFSARWGSMKVETEEYRESTSDEQTSSTLTGKQARV
jgi:hypothetical protein